MLLVVVKFLIDLICLSGELVFFVRRVLEIIPISMFELLRELIHLQTNVIKELPTRMNRHEIKELRLLF